MRFEETPVLEPRTGLEFLAELRRRRPAFVPEWNVEGDAGDALQQIVARYAQIVADRVNQAPDRAFLAFLDLLGISLIPARPARAPVVFTTFAGLGDSTAQAGTRVGANVAGVPSPIVFETESAIALAGARLTDVMTVWPDRDGYAQHSADAGGGRLFTLFQPLQPVPHVLYLAHDAIFDVAKDAAIQVAIELGTPGTLPLSLAWEYWDGTVWQAFKAFDSSVPDGSQDGTAGLTRSGTVSLRPTCGRPARSTVAGIEALWIRSTTTEPLPPDPSRAFATVDRIRARAVVDFSGNLELDAAFAGSLKLDVTSTFYPFGISAIQGGIFYLANNEAFSKHGAAVNVSFTLTTQVPLAYDKTLIRWQYWNGERWLPLPGVKDGIYFADAPTNSNAISFVVPPDLAPTDVNGDTRFWIRAQLVRGGYLFRNKIQVTGPPNQTVEIVEPAGPSIEQVTVIYSWKPAFQPVQQCWTYNDFQFERHSGDVRSPGNFFTPFRPVADATPTLYLGFDAPLPNDLVSLFLDVEESDRAFPPLVWDAWNGEQWQKLAVSDATASLSRPGIVSFITPALAPRPTADLKSAAGTQIVTASALQAAPFRPGELVVVAQADKREARRIAQVADATLTLEAPLAERYNMGTVSLAALPRFGEPRDWVRARLKEDGAPERVRVNGVLLNAVSALQTQTITGEVVGSGNGQAGQTLFVSQFPVLPGEVIEVRELEGARASVELPMLRDELLADGFTDEDIRTVTDPRSGKVREVWVRWRSRPHFYFSAPTDRHYIIERARGRLLFGGPNGRLPTVGVDNIRARSYRAGGGVAGNVARGQIDQLLGGALAQGVSNPRAASGGADGETATAVKDRGPETLRHRWRALSAKDYEAMARESSPGIAAVRVLPTAAPNGRPAPGWVTVIIVPQGQEPRPQPSIELRQQVHEYLAARLPGTVDPSHVTVLGPFYRPVGVAALVTPRARGEAGVVAQRVRTALERFLHPLTGGPEGHGWEFGRDVFLSDVAAILEAVAGVDYVRQLDLLLDDAPVGPRVEIPPDQIVVAGDLRIEMEAGEA
jgi:predicted phage baseplate assembly protein